MVFCLGDIFNYKNETKIYGTVWGVSLFLWVIFKSACLSLFLENFVMIGVFFAIDFIDDLRYNRTTIKILSVCLIQFWLR